MSVTVIQETYMSVTVIPRHIQPNDGCFCCKSLQKWITVNK